MEDRERQLEYEGAQRQLVALLAIAAGVIYLLGVLLQYLTNANEPTVGLLQGLAPALHGLKAAAVDPRTATLRFIDQHAFDNLASGVVVGAALFAMRWPLRYLYEAAVARGERPSAATLGLTDYAAPLLGLVTLVGDVALQLGAHKYLSHAARTSAAYTADVGGTLPLLLQFAQLALTLCVAFVFIIVARRAMRVGLLTKVLGYLGIISGFLFVLALVPLPLLQLLFLVGVGMMLLQLGGLTRPPAWETGEAIPWVSQMQARAANAGGGRNTRAQRSRTASAPAPMLPTSASPAASKKRKRRRS